MRYGQCWVVIGLLAAVQGVQGAPPSATGEAAGGETAGKVYFLRTMARPEEGVEGLETRFVQVRVDAGRVLGPMPPIQGDLSQGAETGDPLFFEEMESYLAELNPQLVRVSPFASIGQALSLDPQGNLQIDFSQADRIVDSIRRTGAKICWNCASWPKDWTGGYPKDLKLWRAFLRRAVEHFNGRGEREIEYFEFWNEPAGFDAKTYEVFARTIVSVDPAAKVGAPAVMDLALNKIESALKHCSKTGTPLHFISFHLYYKPPWEWPELIAKAQRLLDRYPGFEKLEMLVTEWGIDAGESGTCDTRFNAAYYSSVLEAMIPFWPRVRPCHFELREGWDWKGPSRDLFGRWGMLTYSNLLPKPVFQAARMWAQLGPERVSATSSDERVRVVAARAPDRVTVLVWSYPRKYQRMQATDPEHGPSVLDIPVRLDVGGIPFDSPGLSYERYVLDYIHSNVYRHPGRTRLEKVHEVVTARYARDDAFRVQLVLPLHGITLIVLRPAERAPADVEVEPDRYQIWAGQSAEVVIRPRFGEKFPLELLRDSIPQDPWRVEQIGDEPLRLRLTPLGEPVRGQRYFTAWLRRTDWGALSRALAEFRVDSPIYQVRESWRVDLPVESRRGRVTVPLVNRTDQPLSVRAIWQADAPLVVRPSETTVKLPPRGQGVARVAVRVDPDVPPGRFRLTTQFTWNVPLMHVETYVYLPMPSRRARSKPRLDGDLTEWCRLRPLVITGREHWGGHHSARWGGPADLSGKAWSQWDDENLYFAFEVTDDVHYAPVANGAMWKYDCVHLGFDLRRDALDVRQFHQEDDCDYGFTLTDRGVAYRFYGARRPEETPKQVVCAARREGTTTYYEIALPWKSEFAPYAKPKRGTVIGLAIFLRDVDPPEKQGYLRWGRGLRWFEKRPARFYCLQLTE